MRLSLPIRWQWLALATGLPLCVVSLSGQSETEQGRLAVSILTNLQRGISLGELIAKTGIKPQHQFTARLGTNDVSCVKIPFEHPRGSLCFVFRDGALRAIQDLPRVDFETNGYYGTKPRTGPKAVDPEERLSKVVEGRDMSPAEIVEKLEQWLRNEAVASKGKEPMNILPAFIITSPFWLAKTPSIIRAKSDAERLADKFEPCRIKLGMTTNETQAAFGEPEARISGMSNSLVHVYGSKLSPFAPAVTPSVWISVVFSDGKVTRIFSHDFFDKRLVNGVP